MSKKIARGFQMRIEGRSKVKTIGFYIRNGFI